MNLKHLSELDRYKLSNYTAEDGWGRSVSGSHMVLADRGDYGYDMYVRFSDVRDLILKLQQEQKDKVVPLHLLISVTGANLLRRK